MLRYYLLPAVELVLLVYCLISCIQSDSSSVRNLSKTMWVVVIILVPIVGPVAWLVAGRPVDTRPRHVPWPSTATAGFPEYERPRRPQGPDDDPAFLAGVPGPDAEHERLLAEWEATLREREAALRDQGQTSVASPDDGPDQDEVVEDERR